MKYTSPFTGVPFEISELTPGWHYIKHAITQRLVEVYVKDGQITLDIDDLKFFPLIEVKDYAEQIGTSRQAVIARCKRGTLDHIVIGGRYFICAE